MYANKKMSNHYLVHSIIIYPIWAKNKKSML